MILTIAIVVIIVSLGFNCLYAGLLILHRRRIPVGDLHLTSFPKVNIFIPVRNLDDGLEENVTSIFSLDYPNFDVYFAVDGMEDPCMETLERVRARFPRKRCAIVLAGHSLLGNPKAHKLAQLQRRGDAPLIWALDSDVRVCPETLRSLVGEYLRHDARIVFSPIRCRGARTFGSVLEMSYINFFLSGSVLTAWKLLRKRVIVGKSLLIERKTLDQFGGFSYFTDVLAEDHWLGETFAQSGFPVRCNYTWVDTIKETSTVTNYFARMNRWAKLRFNLKKRIYMTEILLNPIALVLLLSPVLKTSAFFIAPIVLCARLLLEYAVFFAINESDRRRPSVILSLAPAVIVKDLFMLIVYVLPFFSHTVTWRGGTIQIGKYTMIALNQENLLYDGA